MPTTQPTSSTQAPETKNRTLFLSVFSSPESYTLIPSERSWEANKTHDLLQSLGLELSSAYFIFHTHPVFLLRLPLHWSFSPCTIFPRPCLASITIRNPADHPVLTQKYTHDESGKLFFYLTFT